MFKIVLTMNYSNRKIFAPKPVPLHFRPPFYAPGFLAIIVLIWKTEDICPCKACNEFRDKWGTLSLKQRSDNKLSKQWLNWIKDGYRNFSANKMINVSWKPKYATLCNPTVSNDRMVVMIFFLPGFQPTRPRPPLVSSRCSVSLSPRGNHLSPLRNAHTARLVSTINHL